METTKHTFKKGLLNLITLHYRGIVIILPPVLCLPILLMNYDKASGCMYILLIMIVYWISEVVPLGVTSMIPLVAFPLLGIFDTDTACQMYFANVLVMFMISIMIATGIEYSNLHFRIALKILQLVGCNPRRLHLGICMGTMFLSFWIANSACTAMMCPIIFAILEQLSAQGVVKQYHDEDLDLPKAERRPSNLASCYYLSVSFAASIGGCGTLIGTPTNLAFKEIYDSRFPKAEDQINFVSYLAYALPPVLVSNVVMYLCMEYVFMGLFRPNSAESKEANVGVEGEAIGRKIIDDKYAELGPLNTHEISVAVLFTTLIVLYALKKPEYLKGWAEFFEDPDVIKNSTTAVFILILLFTLPANYNFLRYSQDHVREVAPALLDWTFVCSKIPWGLIFLVGGGAVLSEGTDQSGMSTRMGHALSVIKVLPATVIVFIVTATAVIMTNFSANVAICNILVPIIAEMAVAMKIHPLSMIYPVGLGCSISFILPVGTPANALVQGYSNVSTKTMMLGGTLPSITTTALFWFFAETWGRVVYPNFSTYPAWADLKHNYSRAFKSLDDLFD